MYTSETKFSSGPETPTQLANNLLWERDQLHLAIMAIGRAAGVEFDEVSIQQATPWQHWLRYADEIAEAVVMLRDKPAPSDGEEESHA